MSVWAVTNVSNEPLTEMTTWAIAKVNWPDGESSYHVVGYCYEGRVSSAIQAWDDEKQIAITKSGRRYYCQVDGYGSNSDAEYVFDIWLYRNGVARDSVKWVQKPELSQKDI